MPRESSEAHSSALAKRNKHLRKHIYRQKYIDNISGTDEYLSLTFTLYVASTKRFGDFRSR